MAVSHGIPDELIGPIQTMRIVTGFDSMKNDSPAAVALRENQDTLDTGCPPYISHDSLE